MQEMRETQILSLSQKSLLEQEVATHSSILAWEIPWTEECSVHGYSPWGRKESDMTEHTQPPPYLHTTSIGPLSGFPAHNDQKLSKGCQGVQKYPQRTDEKQDGEKYNLLQEYLSHISSFWILHTSTQRVLLHHHKTQGAGHLEPSRKGEMVFRAIFKSEGSSSFIRPDSKTPGQRVISLPVSKTDTEHLARPGSLSMTLPGILLGSPLAAAPLAHMETHLPTMAWKDLYENRRKKKELKSDAREQGLIPWCLDLLIP